MRSQQERKKEEREREKGTGAQPLKTVSGIINCRDDLITRLNELPAAASCPCRGADTFSSFGRTEWNVTVKITCTAAMIYHD